MYCLIDLSWENRPEGLKAFVTKEQYDILKEADKQQYIIITKATYETHQI